MKKINKYKIPLSIFLSIILIITSSMFFSANAAKRIKSTKVTLNTGKATIAIGDIVDLNAKMTPSNSTDTLKWSTSNKSIATVNNYGVVTGIKTGKATITVKTTSNKTTKCTVTVKKYLTESEILKLIKAECLSEEQIIKLIKNNSISEEKVKELIASNTLSKEEIEKLIADKTLSESTVRSMIASSTMSTSQVNAIIENYMKNNNTATNNNNWVDGTEVKLYEKQTLPYIIPCNSSDSDHKLTINNITIKKYHYDDFYNGRFSRFKFIFDIKGELPQNKNPNYSYYLDLKMISNNNNTICTYELPFINFDIYNYTEDNGKFTLHTELYNIDYDADKFYIESFAYDCE